MSCGAVTRSPPKPSANKRGSKANNITREGDLLITKYRAIGITVPKDFHYKIDFLPNFEAYQKYSAALGNKVGPGTLGYTRIRVQVNRQDDRSMKPQVPTPIVCYWNHDLPWEIVPTLLHEMCRPPHNQSLRRRFH